MRLNKIFKNTLLVISAGIILTACATKKEVAVEAPKEETKKEEVTKIEKIAGQMQGDVYVGTDSVKYLADGVADRVFFATNESILTTASRETLRAQAAWLRANSNITVVLEGHADERGTREYNLALGERRANSVKEFLVSLGVDSGRITAYMGTLFLLPYTGQGLNMISLFAFLLTLGIVVDDAIIVGESVHSAQSRGLSGVHGALVGTRQVVKPVVFAVISTMVFFAPMFFLPGEWGPASKGIPVVVCLALAFSLIESLLILPSHLAHMKPEPEVPDSGWLTRTRMACASWLARFANERYRPFLEKCLRNHASVGGFFLVLLCLSLALFGGGYLKSAFFPRVNSDFVVGTVELPQGGAFADSQAMRDRLVTAAEAIKTDYNSQPRYQQTPAIDNILGVAGGNKVDLLVQTVNDDLDTEEMTKRLRQSLGDLSQAKDVRFDYTIRDPGKPISLLFASDSIADLEVLAQEVRGALERYPGVFDITDSFDAPLEELVLSLKPAAETLGVSLADVATQIRQAFYGEEVQRIPRDGEDVRVMIRYPESERRAIANINSMYIRTRDGAEVPFSTVATYRVETGYQSIERLDRLRTLEVSADVSEDGAAPELLWSRYLEMTDLCGYNGILD